MSATDTTIEERVLTESDLGTAYTRVPDGYRGPCQVRCTGRSSAAPVFASVYDAEHAARFAVGDLGGYTHAYVEPAPGQRPTHTSWDAWAFE